MTSTKKFIILAISMLAASEAALRGNLDERELSASEECTGRRWHFTLSQSSDSMQCSNDMFYPSAWDDDELYAGFTIFDSISDCCAAIEANGRSCEVIDECAVEGEEVNDSYIEVQSNSDTDMQQCGQKWHMDLKNTLGCTNSKDFPDDWWFSENVEHMLHDTPESCCNKFFGSPRLRNYR